MALRCNGNQFASSGVQHFGATLVNSAYPSALHSNFAQTGRIRNITAGQGITNGLVGLPSGYRHPAAWMMPQKPGLLAARNTITGSGIASGQPQSGYNIAAGISGAGTIPGCDIGLIISIAATLTASGGISSAAVDALASMVATLTGSGDITATAAGLADLGAALTGAGVVVAGNTALMDIAATIRGYGDLTPEGLRDAVWNAILANYPNAGSAGLALATASSGGVDYTALGVAVWESATRTLTSGAAPSTADIAAAILAAAQTTPIHSDVRKVVGITVDGTGTDGDPWGPQ